VDTGENRHDFMSGRSVGVEIHIERARTGWLLPRGQKVNRRNQMDPIPYNSLTSDSN